MRFGGLVSFGCVFVAEGVAGGGGGGLYTVAEL